MRRSHLIWVLGLCLMLAGIGCSGGGGSSQTDGDAPTDGEEDGDTPDGDDSDGDTPDGDCACTDRTDCCDGCNPINEGEDCDDGNGCTLSAACNEGRCVAEEEIVCTALDACHGVGECNPETGTCTNPVLDDNELCDDGDPCTVGDACISGVCQGVALDCSATNECQFDGACDAESVSCVRDTKPNGAFCSALEGIEASGVCLQGECGGFGECDSRTYGQPSKFPCNTGAECAGGLCKSYIHDYFREYVYCSEPCGHDLPPCPNGMVCARQGDGTFSCDLTGPYTLPGNGRLDIYQACNSDEDCAGGLCLAYGQERFCSTNCEGTNGRADQSICGDCGTCQSNGDELSFAYKYYCSVKGKQSIGQPCGMDIDCDSRICHDAYCTGQCWDVLGVDTCPEGFRCTPNVASDILGRTLERDVALCVLVDDLELGFGSECRFNWQCNSGLCQTVAGRSLCMEDCAAQSCEEGVCTGTREMFTDTVLELWADGGEAALVTDNNGGAGNGLSKITYTFNTPGAYRVKVRGNGAYTTGPYTLTITAETGVPVERGEEEPNNEMAAAQALTYPVLLTGAIDSGGDADWYAITIPTGDPVSLRIETGSVWEMRCLPSDMVESVAYGESCLTHFQCESGLLCVENFCTRECTQESDCPDGICYNFGSVSWCIPDSIIGSTPDGEPCNYEFQCSGECWPDMVFQAYLCSHECSQDSDCLPDMGCHLGYCVRHMGGAVYPYGNCRINYDCDMSVCTEGKCSGPCEEAADCEAGSPFDPEEFATCWPCNPANQNRDCNPENANSPNVCVKISDDVHFCAENCTDNPAVCPFGTRCYEYDWFTSVCAPVTFSCDGGAYCSTGNTCKRPTQKLWDACVDTMECISGVCQNGICQPQAGCTLDEDCGCGEYVCTSGFCQTDPAAGVAEIEPNNVRPQAMVLAGSGTVVASFSPVGGVPDVDLFKVSMSAGQVLDVRTSAFCGNANADTFLRLLDSNGQPISGWANDDINPNGDYFSILLGYTATTSQNVYIEVSQSPYVAGLLRANYFLTVHLFTPETNDTCANAQVLGAHEFVAVPLHTATNTMAATGCVQYGAAGKDLFYAVAVPAGHVLTATLTSEADAQLLLIEDCANASQSCLVGSDVTRGAGEESVVWVNDGGATRNLILVVDSFLPVGTMQTSLTLDIDPVLPPDNDTIAGAIEITESGTITGTLTGANDDYDPGVDGCTGAALPGPDVVYVVNMGMDIEFISVRAASRYATLGMYLYRVVDEELVCVANGTSLLTYDVSVGKALAEPYYLVVDTAQEDAYGPITLTVIVGAKGACSGLCDPASYTNECVELESQKSVITDLCRCEAASLTLKREDCTETCAPYDTTHGSCHHYAEDDVNACRCFYDCDAVQEQCVANNGGIYTNCTCAADDPCGWQEDSYCDSYCADAYPEDSFDDSVDCAAE